MDIHALISLAGGADKLAARLKVGRATVWDWKSSGYLPGHRVIQTAEEFGLSVETVLQMVRPPPAPRRVAA